MESSLARKLFIYLEPGQTRATTRPIKLAWPRGVLIDCLFALVTRSAREILEEFLI